MKRLYSLIIAIFLFSFTGLSQTLTIETDTGLPCHYVYIDITASGFSANVAAVQLIININPAQLQFVSRMSGNYTVVSPFLNQIRISKTFDTPTDIDGTLVTLCLHYDGGSAAMQFNTAPDSSYIIAYPFTDPPTFMSCNYVNGNVTEGSYTFNTYYVDAARPSSGDGLSWETAFKYIYDATNLPLKPGEQVLIKPGTYNEKVIIKSNAGYSVRPKAGVILSDTNKITFPVGTSLSCVDLVDYPNQYYAYVYRSWNSNNGYYKVIEVNDALDYIRVEGASFIPETGTVNNRGKVMAAVGRPVIYKKDPAASESQRVIVSAPNGTSNDAFYIGLPLGTDGQTSADSCNWNLIEGIDITSSSTGSLKGLHIQCSAYNTFARGKIYCTTGTGGIGVIITGNSTRYAKYNIIQNNEIYNTPYQAVFIGYPSSFNTSNNFAYYNHIIDNNIYLSGTGTLAKFDNAVKIQNHNKSNVIDGNNIHDLKINTAGNGAVYLGTYTDSTLVFRNILRNIGIETGNNGINACIMMDSTISKVHAYNNIIYNDDTVTNAVYAFRIYGRRHAGSKVAFNTIYKIDNAFYLQDNNANAATIDFGIHNNIISPTLANFLTTGTPNRFTVTYNLFRFSTGYAYESGSGNIIGNPLFIEPDGSNMYGMILTPSSPAIDAGIAITNLSHDYLGDLRGLPPTLGAFDNTMTCTWTGAVNTNWHVSQNWQLQMVPKTYMPVRIPNVLNDPVVSFSNAVCKSVYLLTGASVRVVSPNTITLSN